MAGQPKTRAKREAESGASTSTDTQPKGSGQRKGGGGRKRQPARQDLIQIISLVGTGVAAWDTYDGQRILENAERTADALIAAAKENDALRRALVALTTGTAWGQLAAALVPVVVPILANHGALPRETAVLVGAPIPPEPASTNGASTNGAGGIDLSALFGMAAADDDVPEPERAREGSADAPTRPAEPEPDSEAQRGT